jgi:hypothetical protein
MDTKDTMDPSEEKVFVPIVSFVVSGSDGEIR